MCDKANIRNKLSLSDNDKILITIGKLEEVKGFQFSHRSLYSSSNPVPNVYLLIIGDGPKRKI